MSIRERFPKSLMSLARTESESSGPASVISPENTFLGKAFSLAGHDWDIENPFFTKLGVQVEENSLEFSYKFGVSAMHGGRFYHITYLTNQTSLTAKSS